MLIETVSMLEAHNLMEMLPIEVAAWWESRKLKEEQELSQNRTEALKFCERQIKNWREQNAAASFVKAGE